MLNKRKILVFLMDTALIGLAFFLAVLLRFDFRIPPGMSLIFWQGLCISLLVKPVVFLGTGFYLNLWRFASLIDAVKIVKSVSVSSLIAVFVAFFCSHSFPRSVMVLDWFLLLSFICGSRLVCRLYRLRAATSKSADGYRTLIVGAGEGGSLLLTEIRRQSLASNIVGFVDDDPAKQGMYLSGVPVLGTLNQLREIVPKKSIEEVIIAIPSANGKFLKHIADECTKVGVRCRTLPRIGDIVDGKVSVSQIRDVAIEMLLGREPVMLDEAGIGNYLTGRAVLVSGAAGSIGSEICRQVARFKPTCLILLDHAETPLFYIERELRSACPEVKMIPIIGDVKSKARVNEVFRTFRPEVVFHAAAYKHVQMMEHNPAEAVLNNIGGTEVMADAANRYGVRDFVMISTDKAVNPTSVMGTTKRAAEIYVQALACRSLTRFTTVRFGNVLGSNGSVIPLFMEQIKKGGPVTVTHPEVVRFFMTIPEATQLVLQAGCLGRGGEIFVLDMGEPVRIKTLAEELIKLSGLIPYEDIDVVYTGLCPGEKLYEELLSAGEGIIPTSHEKIRIASAARANLEQVRVELAELLQLAERADIFEMMKMLHRMVNPSYTQDYTLIAAASSEGCHVRSVSHRVGKPAVSTAKIPYLRLVQ